METKNNEYIDLRDVARKLWKSKKLFIKVWVITFVLSCVWILPQPRLYQSEVKLAPEIGGEDIGGGLSSLASSFGVNLGAMGGQDAIYPELYPQLFESPEFIVGLYPIHVVTKDSTLSTDYYTYIKKHQKANVLMAPYYFLMNKLENYFNDEEVTVSKNGTFANLTPLRMTRKDFELMHVVMGRIHCSVDNKTNVISIKVLDQDPLISAVMTDSVCAHLQDFIIRYRTSKANEDLVHYEKMRKEAEAEYDKAMKAYSKYCDTHQNIILQSFQGERDKLENDLAIKQNMLTTMETQLQASKVKLQEKTPSFTTLNSVIVPVKPAAPKRMIFVLSMLVLSTIITFVVLLRSDLTKFFIIYGKRK